MGDTGVDGFQIGTGAKALIIRDNTNSRGRYPITLNSPCICAGVPREGLLLRCRNN
jgi:hypothetical protein